MLRFLKFSMKFYYIICIFALWGDFVNGEKNILQSSNRKKNSIISTKKEIQLLSKTNIHVITLPKYDKHSKATANLKSLSNVTVTELVPSQLRLTRVTQALSGKENTSVTTVPRFLDLTFVKPKATRSPRIKSKKEKKRYSLTTTTKIPNQEKSFNGRKFVLAKNYSLKNNLRKSNIKQAQNKSVHSYKSKKTNNRKQLTNKKISNQNKSLKRNKSGNVETRKHYSAKNTKRTFNGNHQRRMNSSKTKKRQSLTSKPLFQRKIGNNLRGYNKRRSNDQRKSVQELLMLSNWEKAAEPRKSFKPPASGRRRHIPRFKKPQFIFTTEQTREEPKKIRKTREVVEWRLSNGQIIINETSKEDDEIAPRIDLSENVTTNVTKMMVPINTNPPMSIIRGYSTTIERILEEITPATEIILTSPDLFLINVDESRLRPDGMVTTETNNMIASKVEVNMVLNNTSTVKPLSQKEKELEEAYKHESLFARILRFLDKKASYQYYGFAASVRLKYEMISSGCIINGDTVLTVINTTFDVKEDWVIVQTLNLMEFSIRAGQRHDSVIDNVVKIVPFLNGTRSTISGSLIVLLKLKHMLEFGRSVYSGNLNNTIKKKIKLLVVEWQRGRSEIDMDIPVTLSHYSVVRSRKCTPMSKNESAGEVICIKRPQLPSGSSYCGRLGSLLAERKSNNILGILTHSNCNRFTFFTKISSLTEWVYDQMSAM